MRELYFILAVVVLFMLSGCDNENSPDCFKTLGELTEVEVELEPFYAIEVWDEADIHLKNSNTQKVLVKAGKNLIPKINFEVNNGVLTITNENSCNWVREPGNPSIYIYSNDIQDIKTYDYSNFYTEDTLELSYLSIYSDGTGNFDFNINIDTLLIESIYISNFTFSGKALYSNIDFTDDSRFLGSGLEGKYFYIDHKGSNRIEVFPVTELSGYIESTGSIFYFNDPVELDVQITGTGDLINMSF